MTEKMAELTKKKIIARQEAPELASAITMILAEATNIAKAEKREATDEDLVTAALALRQETLSVLAKLPKGCDKSPYVREAAIYELYIPEGRIPKEKTPEEIAAETAAKKKQVDDFIASIPEGELLKSNMKALMAKAKAVEGLDLGLFNSSLKIVLK